MDRNVVVLRALKGAPVSCLLALLCVGRAAGMAELERWTGYSDKPVRKGLELLAELGYVQRHAHKRGWLLTAHGRQMVLGESNPENFRVECSSSSSSLIEDDRVLPETTTTTTPKSEKFRVEFDEEWRELLELLSVEAGCPRRKAGEVLAVCLERGDSVTVVEYDILRWLSYCLSREGESIKHRGGFIGSRLEAGIPCPGWHQTVERYRWKVAALERKLGADD